MEYKDDAANYRKMCEPFPDAETANKEIAEFKEAVSVLRRQYNIQECLVVIKASVIYQEKECIYTTFFGSISNPNIL